MRDLDELYSNLGMGNETSDDAMHGVCNPQLPSANEVWQGVVDKSGEWLDELRNSI